MRGTLIVLALLLVSTPAFAQDGGRADVRNATAGIVIGYAFAPGRNHVSFGLEAGVGWGPERVNAGVTWRKFRSAGRTDTFGYIELDPWYLLGGTLGVGYGTESGVQPVIGIWEALPHYWNDTQCDEQGTVVTISVGLRYSGAHEVYISPKIGRGSIPCYE